MMTDLRGRSSVAIHEAGHAVIARILKLECGGASIDADADSAGHSIISDPLETLGIWEERERDGGDLPPDSGTRPHGTYSSVLRARILAYMAGRAAEEEIIPETAPNGCDEDDRQISFMLD